MSLNLHLGHIVIIITIHSGIVLYELSRTGSIEASITFCTLLFLHYTKTLCNTALKSDLFDILVLN